MTTLYAGLLHFNPFFMIPKQKKTINKFYNPVIIFLQRKMQTNQKTNK